MNSLIYYVVPVVWILFKMIAEKSATKMSGILLLIVAYAVIALSLHYFMHYLV